MNNDDKDDFKVELKYNTKDILQAAATTTLDDPYTRSPYTTQHFEHQIIDTHLKCTLHNTLFCPRTHLHNGEHIDTISE